MEKSTSTRNDPFFAVFLCLLAGPFGLFYVSKRGGLILSVLTVLTFIIGMGVIFMNVLQHPITIEELSILESGNISPERYMWIATPISLMSGALFVQWVISIVWAWQAARENQG